MKLIPNTTIKQRTVREFPNFSEIMDQQLGTRKKSYGISMYNPKPEERPKLPSMISKEKRVYFTTQSCEDKAWVVGSPSYHKENDWNKNPKFKCSKMLIKKRLSIAGEIEHRAKFKEKTSPGPCGYNNHEQKLSNNGKVPGNYK
jgi:hypothetical protein